MSSVFGANIAFIEELYEKYRNDPASVSTSWREFFDDYNDGGARASGAPPVPQSAPEARATPQPAPRPTPVPSPQGNATPLRGAASKIVANMETSLTVPTATTVRNVPVKVLEENRRVINNHLPNNGQPKASYTHLVA